MRGYFSRLRLIHKLVIFAIVFSAINISALKLWPTAEAKEAVRLAPPSVTLAPATGDAGNSQAARAAAALQANQGIIYAPRDVVDITRLVLETTRDQTSHLAHYIELATTIIVVFFSVLGALGAAFGLHKMDDIDKKATALTSAYEKKLSDSKTNVDELEAAFKATMTTAANGLHNEVRDQIELILARVEIGHAESSGLERAEANRMMQNAAKRIKRVMAASNLSVQSKIRALADVAYAMKRLGDLEGAYTNIVQAIELAKDGPGEHLAVLHFNGACYASILDKGALALEHLATALRLVPDYKEKAKTEPDFKTIQDMTKFKDILK